MRKATISSKIARSQAGQKLYGRAWIGKLDAEEFKLVREYGPRRAVFRINGEMLYREIVPRCKSKLVSKVERAIGRHLISDLQQARVYFWLLSRGFDCSQNDKFDRAAIETALAKAKPFEIGRAVPEPTDYRKKPRALPFGKPGRPPTKGPLIMQQMFDDVIAGERTEEQLRHEKKGQLAVEYGCSPNWADEMRKKVLDKLRDQRITDPK